MKWEYFHNNYYYSLTCAGLRYRGCWYLNSRSSRLGLLERTTPDLSDNAFTRVRPVSKCGMAAQKFNYRFFGVTVGYCISGSNRLEDYQLYPSRLCRDGRGAYTRDYGGWYIMDTYEITNGASFSDSLIQITNATQPTHATNSTQPMNKPSTDSTIMEGTSTSRNLGAASSGYKLTHNFLVLVSVAFIVVMAAAFVWFIIPLITSHPENNNTTNTLT